MNVAGSNVGGGGAEERKAGEMSSTSSPLDLRAASTSTGKLLLPTMPSTTMPSSSTTSTSVNATSSGEPGPSSRCNECRGLRRKVEDIEKRFDGRVEDIQKQILAIGNFLCNPTGETSPSAASSSATLPTSSHSVSSTNNRKRPAADNHSAASLVHQPIPMPVQLPPAPPPPQQVQLEYPVALRPSLETCGFTPLLHLWPFMPLSQLQMMPAASPTMPMTLAEANVLQTAVNNSTRRWSSPSSVESTGPKTSDSNESATRGDPVSNDSASSSSEHVIKFNPFAAPLAIPSSSSGQQQQTPVITISTSSERKKLAADDYSKILKEKEHLNMNDIKIPVPEAIMADPNFRPLSENQIITQLVQNKKWDEMEPREAMIQLCKKLAEKRVFGPKLMANTTVAGPNHSTYNNLPCEGIIYIQDVCRRIVGPKLNNPDDFDESFREATKKLAARCRRVRHAKKSKSIMEGSIPLLRESSD